MTNNIALQYYTFDIGDAIIMVPRLHGRSRIRSIARLRDLPAEIYDDLDSDTD